MQGATFLLVINFAIGLSFAIAFLGLSWRARIGLGFWCAAGFVSASATVAVEALAPFAASPRVISGLSFTCLLLAVTLIVAGIARHYRPRLSLLPLFALFAVMAALNFAVTYDLQRGTLGHGLAYQAPLALMMALGAGLVLGVRRGHPADVVLAGVLALSALQFLLKAAAPLLAHDTAPDVRGYLSSLYAYYSQTLGAVLSVMLGLSLLGVIIAEVVAKAMGRLQRDSLSGLLNRAAFLGHAAAVAGALGPGQRVWLVMIDLDHFKSINDRFGHAGGDEVIRSFGDVLNEVATSGHIAGRLGGEEFGLLLPSMSEAALRGQLDAIRTALRGAHYALVPDDVRVTASFGAAPLSAGMRVDQTLRRADLALYQAKAAGRDRVVLADPHAAQDILPIERRKVPSVGR